MSVRSDEVARRGVVRVLWTTLALNVLVSVSKIVVGLLTASAAMTADGLHSLFDGANNVVGVVVVSLAYAPPDEAHPYGHRKFETAATLSIGFLLLGVAYHVVEGAFLQFKEGTLPSIRWYNWLVMGVTLAVNLFVAWYEAREGRRLGSAFLLADSAHTRSDVYVTLGVVASFAGAKAGLAWVDPAVALAIAAFIAVLGVRILAGSFNTLTDRAALPSTAIAVTVRAVPGVEECHDVRTRGTAGSTYVDLAVHVDGGMTLDAAHAVAEAIEAALKRAHPDIVDVVVHLEPTSRHDSEPGERHPRPGRVTGAN